MKAKKKYGQHFLVDDSIAHRIASSIPDGVVTNNVLEVGPGKGILSKHLLVKGYNLAAIEIDEDMIAYLKTDLPELATVHLDFLRADISQIFDGEPFILIGNYPYNISTQIVFKMLENKSAVPAMVGMFQKEVAERIVAPPGSKIYGIMSVLVKAHYDGKYLFRVNAPSFDPPPKVTSAVISLTRHERPLGCDEKLLKRVVKISFGQRRKMLRNTLKVLINNKTILEESVFSKRPEQLGLWEFVTITNKIQEDNNDTREYNND